MVAPFPYEGVAGATADPAESEAANLYRHYSWLARLADEMNDEAELDLKRAMQIVFHCRQFVHGFDVLQTTHTDRLDEVAGVVLGTFAAKKCVWASEAEMEDDLASIQAAALDLADWIEANASEYKQGYSINKEIAPGVMTDEPIKVDKPEELATRLTNYRALWGPKA